MGITADCARFLLYSHGLGLDFSSTLMLGRQRLHVKKGYWKKLLGQTEIAGLEEGAYAEPFFIQLGAKQVHSLDYSAYEKANVIHDLNYPIDDQLKNKYSVVFDGGTLEHIFNFPVAIKNCMDLLQVGGYFISITPCNNQCGHGFYQFSPELFYSVFKPEHGMEMITMFLAVEKEGDERDWFTVANPAEVGERVIFQNNRPAYLMVLAKKNQQGNVPLVVFQSDYQQVWSEQLDAERSGKKSWPVMLYQSLIPGRIRAIIYKFRHPSGEASNFARNSINRQHFKRVTPKL